jgi:aminopeptidase N
MKVYFKFLILVFSIIFGPVFSQSQTKFTKYDYAHGQLNANRSCYDVTCYDIAVKVNPTEKYIEGLNQIYFKCVTSFNQLQLDFYSQLKIDSIIYENKSISYTRDSNIVAVYFDNFIATQTNNSIKIYFSGYPKSSTNAPWDGGFVWSNDSLQQPWVGMACESIGASFWLPCKDHWSDEPDSMHIKLIVPSDLIGISNGKLLATKILNNGYTSYHWFVNNPINLYSIAINIGKYVLIKDTYNSISTNILPPLALSYYVLSYNEARATAHFKQVKKMLACYENYFGLYPFWEDGFKLVETPYWGMEHQSCVSYGNHYKNNKYNFDFIIIHESAHEYFANSITAKDPSDKWIHESFTTYAEALFVEYTLGYQSYLNYLNDQKSKIKNKFPIVGVSDVFYNHYTDNDMYYKGSWMLHTIRNTMANDSLFFNTLKHFYQANKLKIISLNDVIKSFNTYTAFNWDNIFKQYLLHPNLPTFEYQITPQNNSKKLLKYRWENTVEGFNMPLKINTTQIKNQLIQPTTKWQTIAFDGLKEGNFIVDTNLFLIKVQPIKLGEK